MTVSSVSGFISRRFGVSLFLVHPEEIIVKRRKDEIVLIIYIFIL
jgi:hypothetical protein